MGRKPDETKRDDEKQSERFIETARKLGVDESGEAFERALRKMKLKKPKDTAS